MFAPPVPRSIEFRRHTRYEDIATLQQLYRHNRNGISRAWNDPETSLRTSSPQSPLSLFLSHNQHQRPTASARPSTHAPAPTPARHAHSPSPRSPSHTASTNPPAPLQSNDPSLSPPATRDPYDSDSDPASDTDTPLPFPKPLDRTAFLSPAFTATSFLSTLQNRFQTLEDLQSELQDLLRSLNRDLLDLVNDNYADFVDVGARLRGGEERIEEVRVGLLGFRADVGSVAERVGERAELVRGLVGEMRGLRRSVGVGRRLLEVEERLGGLERRVGVKSVGPVDVQVQEQTRMQHEERDENAREQLEMAAHFKDWDDSWTRQDSDDLDLDLDSLPSEDDDEVATEQGQTQTQTQAQRIIPRRLRHNLETLQIITHLSTRCAAADGKPHPFILAQRDRIAQVKDALRRELEAAIRAQSDVGAKQSMIRLRGQLDEE